MRVLAILLLLAVTAWFFIDRRRSAPSLITRAEALAIAESYVTHEWIPAETNAFHGVDPAGIRVDTPDQTISPRARNAAGGSPVSATSAFPTKGAASTRRTSSSGACAQAGLPATFTPWKSAAC